MKSLIKVLFAAISTVMAVDEPNPPTWNADAVKIFDPADDQTTSQALLDAIYAEVGT